MGSQYKHWKNRDDFINAELRNQKDLLESFILIDVTVIIFFFLSPDKKDGISLVVDDTVVSIEP